MHRTVHLYVLDTMADWEPGYAIAGINHAAYQQDPGTIRVVTVGPSREAVVTMGGIRVLPDMSLEEVGPTESAMLILPGGLTWDEGQNGEAVELAQSFLQAGVPVAAICGATAGLARAGLLDSRPHTSNAPEYLADVPGYAGHAHYVNERAVRDGDLITAGAASPVHFARCVFERLELYEAAVLEAWFALYTTGDMSAFYALESGLDA